MRKYYHAVYVLNVGKHATQIVTATASFSGNLTPKTIEAMEDDIKSGRDDVKSAQLLSLIRIHKPKREVTP